MTLNLYLARHGETEWSKSGRHTGRTDIPLTPEGESRARQLGNRLRGIEFMRVYTSPLQRARRTAALAGFPEAAPTDLLLEYDYGQYEGVTTHEIRETRPGWELYRDGCPGGETPAHIYERAQGFIAEAQRDGGRVLAFAHGHILRAVGAAFLEEPVEFAIRLNLDTAALSMLQDGAHGRVLGFWNLAPGQ
ncbi:MAG: histidine phosphatase family protein [Chloroflexi bacterium]|nr:MAG: histidine phosphatase family protein [Chloroflexota bacterium]